MTRYTFARTFAQAFPRSCEMACAMEYYRPSRWPMRLLWGILAAGSFAAVVILAGR